MITPNTRMYEKMSETQLPDGTTIRPGDEAEILPVDLMEKYCSLDHVHAQNNCDFLRDYLGKGPLIVAFIGEWPEPNHEIKLYFNIPGMNQPGIRASYFMLKGKELDMNQPKIEMVLHQCSAAQRETVRKLSNEGWKIDSYDELDGAIFIKKGSARRWIARGGNDFPA